MTSHENKELNGFDIYFEWRGTENQQFHRSICEFRGSSPDRVVLVRALAGDIVLCSWAIHFTLTVPLSTQECKWVPATGTGT